MVEFAIPARRRKTRGALSDGVLVACVVLAGGCTGALQDEIGRVGTDRQPSYKTSRSAPPLEIPPDLTSSSIRDTLAIPGVGATYSQHASGEAGSGTQSAAAVLPEVENARIERSGDQRWLVISMAPDEAWSRLRDFWVDQGFAVETAEPDVGVMETDWAAVETPLPAGALKRLTNLINKGLHGVAVRDRYRTRIERGAEAGTTEIYISHRGAEQTYIRDDASPGQQDDVGKMVWQPRPSDPGLEAVMLSRLMIFLGVDEQRANAAVAEGAAAESRARLVNEDGGTPSIALDEGFSRAWRRTGAALDRAGFTVEDRDRSRGLFFVQYSSQGDGAQNEKSGWLSRLKFWEDAEADEGDGAYLVRVVGETAATSSIAVLDEEGNPLASPTAQRILTVLHEQLE